MNAIITSIILPFQFHSETCSSHALLHISWRSQSIPPVYNSLSQLCHVVSTEQQELLLFHPISCMVYYFRAALIFTKYKHTTACLEFLRRPRKFWAFIQAFPSLRKHHFRQNQINLRLFNHHSGIIVLITQWHVNVRHYHYDSSQPEWLLESLLYVFNTGCTSPTHSKPFLRQCYPTTSNGNIIAKSYEWPNYAWSYNAFYSPALRHQKSLLLFIPPAWSMHPQCMTGIASIKGLSIIKFYK